MIVKITSKNGWLPVKTKPKWKKGDATMVDRIVSSVSIQSSSPTEMAAIKRDSLKFKQMTDLSERLSKMDNKEGVSREKSGM